MAAFTLAKVPGPSGTGDSKQATVGLLSWDYATAGVPVFFLLANIGWGWGWERDWYERGLKWVWEEVVCVCECARKCVLTSRRLCKWCCGPMGPIAAPSPDPICSTSIWTLLSSRMPLVLAKFWRCCRNATRPENTDKTKQCKVDIDSKQLINRTTY